MDGNLDISIDKLPIKRLEVIEENGVERFPSDVGYEEKRLDLTRRIDFAWAVEREEPSGKKQKKTSSTKETQTSSNQPWQWNCLVENLRLAHQELSVIIDLINTVETNDAVTVASMTRPKQLPNELLSDLAVSTATKLQCFRHLGKYIKQSAKALEQQVAREARFYGALIRLQHNWKVKRHRTVAAASGNGGFYIDLFDNSLNDPAATFRPSSVSTVRVEHDSAGMLAVNLPPNSCRSLQFEFLDAHSVYNARRSSKTKVQSSSEDSYRETKKDHLSDDECVRETHALLREVHQTIFYEQVFELVNREAFNPSIGVNVTGIQENYLRLSIGQEASVSISLVPSGQDNRTVCVTETNNVETANRTMESFEEGRHNFKKSAFPNQTSFEIYLQQLFHEHVFVKAKSRAASTGRSKVPGQTAKDSLNLLGHFSLSLAHRIFSIRVFAVLENLVHGIPYVHLMSHPTWHSRTSSWTLSIEIPQSNLLSGNLAQISAPTHIKSIKSQFWTKVLVNDDSISVEGEGAPDVVGLFKGKSETISPMNRYNCDLADLPVILLQQVASQIIRWLHDEALSVGIKANRDFLSLSFELDQGEVISLVSHIDPEDSQGCISWWLVMEDGYTEEHKLRMDVSNSESDTRKFLGYLSLDVLYSTVFDLVGLCGGGGIH
ncbi:hypothetical protein ACH5RR_004300 [Cinchona calisaya]|uniref:Mediator of RNA polymerase II transcription subunit 17 n=1 Tax=Cinchona calisaya TaxID=153742 RepID=A0ABD3AX97_9GENT